ncbi:unnamed protein product [Closterium sp. Naga37s-1]|nr:unnamed protein product [Closterium sp. Naga37s-1]
MFALVSHSTRQLSSRKAQFLSDDADVDSDVDIEADVDDGSVVDIELPSLSLSSSSSSSSSQARGRGGQAGRGGKQGSEGKQGRVGKGGNVGKGRRGGAEGREGGEGVRMGNAKAREGARGAAVETHHVVKGRSSSSGSSFSRSSSSSDETPDETPVSSSVSSDSRFSFFAHLDAAAAHLSTTGRKSSSGRVASSRSRVSPTSSSASSHSRVTPSPFHSNRAVTTPKPVVTKAVLPSPAVTKRTVATRTVATPVVTTSALTTPTFVTTPAVTTPTIVTTPAVTTPMGTPTVLESNGNAASAAATSSSTPKAITLPSSIASSTPRNTGSNIPTVVTVTPTTGTVTLTPVTVTSTSTTSTPTVVPSSTPGTMAVVSTATTGTDARTGHAALPPPSSPPPPPIITPAKQTAAQEKQARSQQQQREAAARQKEAAARQKEAAARQKEAAAQEAAAQQRQAAAQQQKAAAQQREAAVQQKEAAAQEAAIQQKQAAAQQQKAAAQQKEAAAQEAAAQKQKTAAQEKQTVAAQQQQTGPKTRTPKPFYERMSAKWHVTPLPRVHGAYLLQQKHDYSCVLLVQDLCYLFMAGKGAYHNAYTGVWFVREAMSENSSELVGPYSPDWKKTRGTTKGSSRRRLLSSEEVGEGESELVGSEGPLGEDEEAEWGDAKVGGPRALGEKWSERERSRRRQRWRRREKEGAELSLFFPSEKTIRSKWTAGIAQMLFGPASEVLAGHREGRPVCFDQVAFVLNARHLNSSTQGFREDAWGLAEVAAKVFQRREENGVVGDGTGDFEMEEEMEMGEEEQENQRRAEAESASKTKESREESEKRFREEVIQRERTHALARVVIRQGDEVLNAALRGYDFERKLEVTVVEREEQRTVSNMGEVAWHVKDLFPRHVTNQYHLADSPLLEQMALFQVGSQGGKLEVTVVEREEQRTVSNMGEVAWHVKDLFPRHVTNQYHLADSPLLEQMALFQVGAVSGVFSGVLLVQVRRKGLLYQVLFQMLVSLFQVGKVGLRVEAWHVKGLFPRHVTNQYHLADSPLLEQMALFQHTALFISMHGASLSNLIFLPPGSTDLELFTFKFHSHAYKNPHTALFISMHGASLSNLIFLPPGSSVLELFPFNTQHCSSACMAPPSATSSAPHPHFFAPLPFPSRFPPNLLQHTALFISMHGASLSNLIFLPPGSTILEPFPFKFHSDAYKNLALRTGINYFMWENTHPESPFLSFPPDFPPPPSPPSPSPLPRSSTTPPPPSFCSTRRSTSSAPHPHFFAPLPFPSRFPPNLLQHTALFISMHGASLSNLIFLPPGSSVLELFPLKFHSDAYKNLALRNGLNYFTWENTHPEASSYTDNCLAKGGWENLEEKQCREVRGCFLCARDHSVTMVNMEELDKVLLKVQRAVRRFLHEESLKKLHGSTGAVAAA